MKCIVFGGTGFLGVHTCKALLAQGHEVAIYARNAKVFQAQFKNVVCYQGDFTQEENFIQILDQVDVVIHAISTTNVSNPDCVWDVQTNIVPTIRLLEACVQSDVKKVVFFSSGGTLYGMPEAIPIKEEALLKPISSYGMQKLVIEQYLRFFQRKGLKSISLRFANPYGPGQNPHGNQGVIAAFLAKALLRQPIQIWGSAHIIRDFVYIADAVAAVLAAIDYAGHHSVFNIGSGRGISLKNIIDEIIKITGSCVDVEYQPGRSADVPINVLNIEKAANVLDWKPYRGINEGIGLMNKSWNKQTMKFDL